MVDHKIEMGSGEKQLKRSKRNVDIDVEGSMTYRSSYARQYVSKERSCSNPAKRNHHSNIRSTGSLSQG